MNVFSTDLGSGSTTLQNKLVDHPEMCSKIQDDVHTSKWRLYIKSKNQFAPIKINCMSPGTNVRVFSGLIPNYNKSDQIHHVFICKICQNKNVSNVLMFHFPNHVDMLQRRIRLIHFLVDPFHS